jgi:hypothetical protein
VKLSELPADVASKGEWKLWPRKAEAHLQYGCRERQITACLRQGKLVAYSCPDQTVRIDSVALTEMWGPPGIVQGRDKSLSVSERERRKLDAELGLDGSSDPLVGLFREVVLMLRESRQEKSELVRLIVEPMNSIHTCFKEQLGEARERIKFLESKWIETHELFAVLSDASHERAIALQRQTAADKRRSDVVEMLKEQLPSILSRFAGSDLKGFVAGIPPEVVQAVLDSEMLPKGHADLLRRAAGVSEKKATNGVSHGNS